MKTIKLKRTFRTGENLVPTLDGMAYVFTETVKCYGIEKDSEFLLTIKIEKIEDLEKKV